LIESKAKSERTREQYVRHYVRRYERHYVRLRDGHVIADKFRDWAIEKINLIESLKFLSIILVIFNYCLK